MSEFAFLPLQKLLNRGNPISRIEMLERNKSAPSARVGQLGQVSQNTGNLVVDGSLVVVDGDDGLANITMDRDGGITLRNQIGAVIFQNLTGTAFDNVLFYIDSADIMTFENAIPNKGIIFSTRGAASTDNIDTTFGSGGVDITSAYPGIGYSINAVKLGWNQSAAGEHATPADATTYYFGSIQSTLTSTGGRRRVYVHRAGTVTRIALFANFVNGTNETSSAWFRLNDTTDTLISNAVAMNSTPYAVVTTGLSIAVAAGDFFEIKWTSPTWATNPTALIISAQVWIEPT